ncbi:hypothetical protein [Cupriavidus sp. SW-Y-13]|uniref:hypothetical protein n=1 Tax=Cupriavidus sp. SW-Y-13 TaxID=2653854 RepID=UPI001366005A|nr:hypothetical protein [Cupriavidus sp. SW-Y-13]MWL90513.1 hypothetical protein [Cupriavidus sp. SW-Y-13]
MVKDPTADARLARLEQYLREDPNNLPLLDEAYQTACAAGEWERARFHLRHAAALGVTGPAVEFKESRIDLALHNWAAASERLEALLAAGGLSVEADEAITHDLAYAAFRQGDLARARDALAPRLSSLTAPSAPAALQVLWLRVLHHSGDLDGAVAWARERMAAHTLATEAAGVASLAALDLGQLDMARAWAVAALGENDQRLEPLVTMGTVALAERNAARAEGLLRQALAVHAEDGRAWSALGFVHLLEMQFDDALFDFHRAVQNMPGHVGTWNGLGWTNIVRRDIGAAENAFARAVELDRNFGESHGGLAVAYAMQGKREAAEASISRANGLDKGNLASHYAQAILNGDARDGETIRRLAMRLLARREGPAGGSMADWIQPVVAVTVDGASGDSGAQ